MTRRVDLFDSTYSHFTDPTLDAIRKETFGIDIGQNSWTTVDEYDRLVAWLELKPGQRALEIASGAGGPALYLARRTSCCVTGIDNNAGGVATASELATRLVATGQIAREQVRFTVADATAPLAFEDASFDAVVCMDSMNHFPDRATILREWRRVLRGGGRVLFTDPVVISGPVTNDELALRSSIGLFVFVPPGVNERFIEQAGLRLMRQEDVTANAALTSGRWHAARQRHRDELLGIEGEQRFEGLQRFFETVHALTIERRLSRIAYLAENPA